MKLFLEVQLLNYARYLKSFSTQLLDRLEELRFYQDFAILPVSATDFEILNNKSIDVLLQVLEFKKPSAGSWTWKIPGYLKQIDIDCMLKSIENAFTQAEKAGNQLL